MALMGGLVLLSYSLETLFKNLDHMVTLLFLIYELFVENLVDTRDRFFYFGEHNLKFTLKLWHDMIGHRLLELMMNNLSNRSIRQLRRYPSHRWRRRLARVCHP